MKSNRQMKLYDCFLHMILFSTFGTALCFWRSKKRKTVNELHITLFTDIDTKSLHIWIQAYEQFLGQRILVEISRL